MTCDQHEKEDFAIADTANPPLLITVLELADREGRVVRRGGSSTDSIYPDDGCLVMAELAECFVVAYSP